ncbi:hypothetical protein [Flagellimonas amoyensis]|uniref:hypothetical protein n=1 Tax=Flagellimonas amoyensis TaxID=2169401 RepID=UPI000D38CD7D|nr:hypothetical protein [Allomuricauda amoyensis]
MIFKYSLLTIFILGSAIIGCENMAPEKTNTTITGEDVLATLDSLSYRLSANKSPIGSEEVIQVNEDMRRTVESIRTPHLLTEIAEIYAYQKHAFTFTLSEDQKIGVFSWHTKMDATGNRIKNIALYNNGNDIEPTSLYDTPITYEKIHQVKSHKGKDLYILHGHLNSGDSHYFRLNAYTLRNGYMEEAPIFPNSESSLSFAQISNNPELSNSLGFKVEMNGIRILLPEIQDVPRAGHSLAFNGKKYLPEPKKN